MAEMHTIDGVPIVQGLAVFDYNLDVGTIDLTNMSMTGWFDVVLLKGGRSLMNASRVWTVEPWFEAAHGQRRPRRAASVWLEEVVVPGHDVTYGVSNSADCTCGESFHGTLAEDLDREVFQHLWGITVSRVVKR